MSNLPKALRFPDLPPGYDPLDPWASDRSSDRKKVALSLERYFASVPKQSGVVAINAGWGMGKSLFLRMWQDSMLNDGKPSLYFNAWEYDFTDSPIVSFLTALERQAQEIGERFKSSLYPLPDGTAPPPKQSQIEKARDAVTQRFMSACSTVQDMAVAAFGFMEKVGPNVTAHTLAGMAAVGAALNGVPPQAAPAIYGTVKDVSTALLSDADSGKNSGDTDTASAQALLKNTSSAVARMGDFRTLLGDYATTLTAGDQSPLIIMVDELDRCRPHFAIALLEEIKHLFAVPGVYFVLGVEKMQLANCIRALYGLSEEGAIIYLDKFIDLTIELPLPNRESFGYALYGKAITVADQHFLEVFAELIEICAPRISLRGLAQVMVQFDFVRAQLSEYYVRMGAFILLLLMHCNNLDGAYSSLRHISEQLKKDQKLSLGKVYIRIIDHKIHTNSGLNDLKKEFESKVSEDLPMSHLPRLPDKWDLTDARRFRQEIESCLNLVYGF